MSKLIYDFSTTQANNAVAVNQEMALIPADLAIAALTKYFEQLSRVSYATIIKMQIDKLYACNSVEEAIECSRNFIAERMIMESFASGNFTPFELKPTSDDVQ